MSEPSAPATDSLDLAALERWLRQHISGFQPPAQITKFAGGQSNPTYRVDARSGSYVLRRKPFGPVLPSAHAVDREFRALSALHPTGFPVPRPLGLCTDDTTIGAAFYVMELIEGRTLWDGSLPGLTPAERRATYEAMIDTLAALHEIDPVNVGLSDYAKPGNYFGRQVGRWIKQYRASQTEHLEAIEQLIEWLPTTVPPQTRTAIVHGDYRIDNLIFAPGSARVLAVLDWELSTLGDPLADLSYFAMNWVAPTSGRSELTGLDLAALGIPTLEEMIERYCRATAREGVPDLNWYFAYNLFRVTSIVQGIKKRFLDGNASSANAAAMTERIPQLAEVAWQFALQAGARLHAK